MISSDENGRESEEGEKKVVKRKIKWKNNLLVQREKERKKYLRRRL